MKLFLSCELSLCSLPFPPASNDRLARGGRRSTQTEEQMRGEEVEGEIAAFFFCARMFKTSPAFTLGGIQPCGEHQFSFAPGFEASVSEVFVSRLRCGRKSLSFEMAMWKNESSTHEMIGHVSSKCHSNSVLSAGFMHRNGAISTRASRLN